jgi:hypothetical protein
MAKKMAIVPMDLVSKLQMAAQTDGSMAHLAGLNRKLDASLLETQLPPDVQAMKFGNLYNRYNAYKDSQLRPQLEIPLHLPDVPQAPPQQPAPPAAPIAGPPGLQQLDDILILQGMPASSQENATKLLDYLKRHNDISWDNQGVVSISGTAIPQSSIGELMHHFSRNMVGTPVGSRAVSAVLARGKVPITYIQNTKWKSIMKAQSAAAAASPSTPASAYGTPNMSDGTPKRGRTMRAKNRWTERS